VAGQDYGAVHYETVGLYSVC